MKVTEIRQRFLNYFASRQHEIVASSSLVPSNDATLLFTNAGMVQFKDVFLGAEKRPYVRATTSQRCVRAGGKHNDLENVGYTARHHTFFEMLGNFSFGDYFKRDAIHFAWQLLTEEFEIPGKKLWVTVYEEDDEAEAVWINDIGIPKDKVTRIGARDNFWQMGDTGPCGPCSEIFYDHGPEVSGGPPGSAEEDGDRYIEIWNLVFMQYNRDSDGSLHPLPKPSVDTGMGLERMSAVLQGVHSNYEIDLFKSLINQIATVLGVTDTQNKSLRVIADHIRSTAFMIVDGVMPSNEGRGYVLRRIIRRAIRHGYQLGYKKPFMHKLVQFLADEMGQTYVELINSQLLVEQVLERENKKFNETLEQGLTILDQEIADLSEKCIPGETVFKLYDTFGFPADLTADVARERGLEIDSEGFDSYMEQQRQRARLASQFGAAQQIQLPDDIAETNFVGYQNFSCEAMVTTLVKQQKSVEKLEMGDEAILTLKQTPFYAESGGQTGDHGKITLSDGVFEVADCQYLPNKVIGHIGKVVMGTVSVGDKGLARITSERRLQNANNHSATHLLHAALKQILGEHVEQKGSLVKPQRLRFDFSHFQPMTDSEVKQVAVLVNRHIRANHNVAVEVMALEQARAAGAAALFSEKYDDQVRVVKMGEFSLELCGGTHVQRTGDIGVFQIISETGIAAGVRRVEAVTGVFAEKLIDEQQQLLDQITFCLKTKRHNVVEKINQLIISDKQQKKKIQVLQSRLFSGVGDVEVKRISGIKAVVVELNDSDKKSMRMVVDQWRNKLQSGVVLVMGVNDEKVTLICGVSKDIQQRISAGDVIKKFSPLVDGQGGGTADLAQGGGTKVAGVAEITSQFEAGLSDLVEPE